MSSLGFSSFTITEGVTGWSFGAMSARGRSAERVQQGLIWGSDLFLHNRNIGETPSFTYNHEQANMTSMSIFSKVPHDAPPSTYTHSCTHFLTCLVTNQSRVRPRGENLPCLTPPPRISRFSRVRDVHLKILPPSPNSHTQQQHATTRSD